MRMPWPRAGRIAVTRARHAAVALIAAVLAGCAQRPPEPRGAAPAAAVESGSISETTPIPAGATRGTPAQRAQVAGESGLAVYRTVVRDFFRPTRGQARWIDPRPLPDARTIVEEDRVRADDAWAAAIVAAIGHPNVCALEGDDGECRGRAGGVLRLSAPYAVGTDSAVVFARYATVHAGEEPAQAARVAGRQGPELQFWLVRQGAGWRLLREATLQPR